MARATPRVAGATLVDPAAAAQAITVGTSAWYAWLEGATTFAFVGVSGSFTAHKERRGPADGYWRAYRKHAGVVRSAYLGRTADLTLERLQAAAASLAAPTIPGGAAPAVGAAPPLPPGPVTLLFIPPPATPYWHRHLLVQRHQRQHAALGAAPRSDACGPCAP